MKTIDPLLSLVISITALTIAISVYARADAIAERATRRREQQIVDRLKPRIHSVYREFEIELSPEAVDPKSLDDLLVLMFRSVTGLQSPG